MFTGVSFKQKDDGGDIEKRIFVAMGKISPLDDLSDVLFPYISKESLDECSYIKNFNMNTNNQKDFKLIEMKIKTLLVKQDQVIVPYFAELSPKFHDDIYEIRGGPILLSDFPRERRETSFKTVLLLWPISHLDRGRNFPRCSASTIPFICEEETFESQDLFERNEMNDHPPLMPSSDAEDASSSPDEIDDAACLAALERVENDLLARKEAQQEGNSSASPSTSRVVQEMGSAEDHDEEMITVDEGLAVRQERSLTSPVAASRPSLGVEGAVLVPGSGDEDDVEITMEEEMLVISPNPSAADRRRSSTPSDDSTSDEENYCSPVIMSPISVDNTTFYGETSIPRVLMAMSILGIVPGGPSEECFQKVRFQFKIDGDVITIPRDKEKGITVAIPLSCKLSFPKITQFYISQKHKRKGYGTKCMNALCDYLGTLGHRQVIIASPSKNAITFYKSVGFHQSHTLDLFRRLDEQGSTTYISAPTDDLFSDSRITRKAFQRYVEVDNSMMSEATTDLEVRFDGGQRNGGVGGRKGVAGGRGGRGGRGRGRPAPKKAPPAAPVPDALNRGSRGGRGAQRPPPAKANIGGNIL